jgi:hypothetical protein
LVLSSNFFIEQIVHILLPLFATRINNTSGTGENVTAGVVDTGGKFATGVIDDGGAP